MVACVSLSALGLLSVNVFATYQLDELLVAHLPLFIAMDKG